MACKSVFVRARPLDGRRVARSPAALGAVAVKPVVAAVGAGSAACIEELPAAAGPVSGASAAGAGAACLAMCAADPPKTPSTMDVIVADTAGAVWAGRTGPKTKDGHPSTSPRCSFHDPAPSFPFDCSKTTSMLTAKCSAVCPLRLRPRGPLSTGSTTQFGT